MKILVSGTEIFIYYSICLKLVLITFYEDLMRYAQAEITEKSYLYKNIGVYIVSEIVGEE